MQYNRLLFENTPTGPILISRKKPQDQTVAEWLEDYENHVPFSNRLKGQQPTGFKDLHTEEDDTDMRFAETSGGIDFDPAPNGMRIARCIKIIDLGTAHDAMYHKEKHNVYFQWELPTDMHSYQNKEGDTITEPFTIGKFYNMTLTEGSHLRNDLESWRGRGFTAEELVGFDPRPILGVPCMLNIVHKQRKAPKTGISAVVASVTPLVKGMDIPPAHNPLVFFSLEPGEFDPNVFDNLSQGLKAQVMQSNEYRALTMGQPAHQQEQQAAMQPQGGPPAGHPAHVPQGQTTAPPQQQPAGDEFDDIPF
jgi:hypothetical protein